MSVWCRTESGQGKSTAIIPSASSERSSIYVVL